MGQLATLLEKVLRTWDRNDEGRHYLSALVDADPRNDGGSVLREAVLEVTEAPTNIGYDAEQSEDMLEWARSAMEPFLPDLPLEKRALAKDPYERTREEKEALEKSGRRHTEEFAQSVRHRADIVRFISYTLGCSRTKALSVYSEWDRDAAYGDEYSNEQEQRKKSYAQALRAEAALLSELATMGKTSADSARAREVARELRDLRQGPLESLAPVHIRKDFIESLKRTLDEKLGLPVPAEPEPQGQDPDLTPDEQSFYFDRYYAHQATKRLSHAVERGSALESLQLEVDDASVKKLFSEAHEVYLFGFDVACIALCRGLVEHSVRERVPSVRGEFNTLGTLLERAEEKKLLDGPALEAAKTVCRQGNEVMHELSKLRKTARDVLDYTRIVLNELYGDHQLE